MSIRLHQESRSVLPPVFWALRGDVQREAYRHGLRVGFVVGLLMGLSMSLGLWWRLF